MNEYRCTRKSLYEPSVPLSARQGHYVKAANAFQAELKMAEKFPRDRKGFTVELWK